MKRKAEASALPPSKRPRASGDTVGSQQGAIESQQGAIDMLTVPSDKQISLEKQTQVQWVYKGHAMVYQSVSYNPVLYTIFDEILMSLTQKRINGGDMIDDLDVYIKVDKCCISIYRYGLVFPIEQDDFNPWQLSKNYMAQDPSIFKKLSVRTFDGQGQKYKKVLYAKSGKKKKVKVTRCHDELPCTLVTFYPNIDRLDDDIVALMSKRVVDVAGLLGQELKVELNGHVLLNKFPDYVDLYLQTSERIYQNISNTCEICVSLSIDGQFQQFNFARGIVTYNGDHADSVTSNIEKYLIRELKMKMKMRKAVIQSETRDVKRHLWVFINSRGPEADPNVDPHMLNSFLTQVADSFIFKEVFRCALKEALALGLSLKEVKEADESIQAIPKFEDATRAGGEDSHKCTLIITEGDSAKSLANVGQGVAGRDLYGVFALKGKLLNVRDASLNQILGNEEINNMRKIIGLDYKKDYSDRKDLRYGQIMIMTDQDPDGFHIKGLVINFFHVFWPSLLKIPSFLSEFVTPLVKVTDCSGKSSDEKFYTMPQFKAWEESKKGTDLSTWSIKYYKGLGTSTLEEGTQYFKDIDIHQKDIEWVDEEDDKAMEIAFSKDKVEERKNWILKFKPETFLPQSEKTRILDFINKGLILYSILDVQRSIPSMVDGLKTGQRKILFSAFKRNLNKEIKVAQFAGYVAECSAYHHAEENLSNTIVGMAQDFVGSNNINVLHPGGQFGTRLEGGKDAARARYIFTDLSNITRTIFNENDDTLLHYLHEDGQLVEPIWYLPILPMILVNGGEGIGTGWSTKIPSYNPHDIIRNLKLLMQSKGQEEMKPWFRKFNGEVNQTTKKYTTSGIIDVINNTTLKISELPMKITMEKYEKKLKSFMEGNDKFIKGYEKMQSSINDVEIKVHLHENSENLAQADNKLLLKKFKLIRSVHTSNMHLLDSDGKVKKYDNPQQILEEFFFLRLAFYKKRKEMLLNKAKNNLKIARNKIKFIEDVIGTREINFFGMDKEKLRLELRARGFETILCGENGENQDGAKVQGLIKGYEYLLLMPIVNFTAQMVLELKAQCEYQKKNITELENTSAEKLWLRDLDAFEKEFNILDQAAQMRNVVSHDEIARNASTSSIRSLANVPSEGTDDGLSSALREDLDSLTGTKWITDGVIEKIFGIFSNTFSKKVLLLTQGLSTMLTRSEEHIRSLQLLNRKLVFIPLNDVQARPHSGDAGRHFSLLVLDNTKKDKPMFRHYDSLGTTNQTVAESVATSIKQVLHDLAEVKVDNAPVPHQMDSYNCGIYVLAITEAICEWFMNRKSLKKQKSVKGYDSFVEDKVKDPLQVHNMRRRYHMMIVESEGVRNPGWM